MRMAVSVGGNVRRSSSVQGAEDGLVRVLGALGEPREPFEPVARVDDRERHGTERVAGPDVLHEHEGRDLETEEADAERRAEVASPFPGLLLVRDELRLRPKLLRQEVVAELGRPFLEVDLVVRAIEGVVGHHLEEREVAAAPAHLLEIDEP